jgi:hypothetical protein
MVVQGSGGRPVQRGFFGCGGGGLRKKMGILLVKLRVLSIKNVFFHSDFRASTAKFSVFSMGWDSQHFFVCFYAFIFKKTNFAPAEMWQ